MKLREAVTLSELTQSILALVVVVGGGVAMMVDPSSREVMAGVIGMVIGYYFNRAGSARVNSSGNGGSS